MSAATAALVETPTYLEATVTVPDFEETVRDLIHELRQPLSSIEAIAYYLEMTLPAGQFQARLHLRRLQQLVEQANVILGDAASDVRKPVTSANRV